MFFPNSNIKILISKRIYLIIFNLQIFYSIIISRFIYNYQHIITYLGFCYPHPHLSFSSDHQLTRVPISIYKSPYKLNPNYKLHLAFLKRNRDGIEIQTFFNKQLQPIVNPLNLKRDISDLPPESGLLPSLSFPYPQSHQLTGSRVSTA